MYYKEIIINKNVGGSKLDFIEYWLGTYAQLIMFKCVDSCGTKKSKLISAWTSHTSEYLGILKWYLLNVIRL